ncbi:calcium-binding protein [Natronobacterium texcoconense]|uniref:Calcium-binding outer membrane-like protein n=1 Tax=Natronobacterium texcoconense TaxID=1095778 RepID=A0A1H1B0L0_NATTX|nr:calcium-binding protein [Natronobacterium texcoconense]SDQ45430.1 hypothetical protein SAMN04489842_0878 [Natronobacterium texcoconense]
MTPNDQEYTEESRGLEKRGVAGATALAAGAGIAAATGSVTAQETQEIVIKANDYYPNEEFVVLTDYEERNRTEFFEEYDSGEDVFEDSDDWDVYSILVEVGEPSGRLAVMMIDNDVDPNPGDRGTMGDSASFKDAEWDLIELDVEFDDDVDDEDDDNEADDEADEDEADSEGSLG